MGTFYPNISQTEFSTSALLISLFSCACHGAVSGPPSHSDAGLRSTSSPPFSPSQPPSLTKQPCKSLSDLLVTLHPFCHFVAKWYLHTVYRNCHLPLEQRLCSSIFLALPGNSQNNLVIVFPKTRFQLFLEWGISYLD